MRVHLTYPSPFAGWVKRLSILSTAVVVKLRQIQTNGPQIERVDWSRAPCRLGWPLLNTTSYARAANGEIPRGLGKA